jgi:hypothetical protein
MGSPKSQLAKSVGKVSAKNLQMLSIMGEFYHLPIAPLALLTPTADNSMLKRNTIS